MSIRNEDAIHIMCLVCKQLMLDYRKIADSLMKVISKVISLDMVNEDTDALMKETEIVKQKRTDLIRLYINKEIDHNEFTALRAKYDDEIGRLESVAENNKRQQDEKHRQKKLMEDIGRVVDELMGGIEYEDEFYTKLLDKIVVYDRESIDVYLNSLPFKWSYKLAGISYKGIRA